MSTSSTQAALQARPAKGRLGQPGVLGIADAVLNPGMAPVAGLQIGDVGIGRVGDEDLVAPSLGVEQG